MRAVPIRTGALAAALLVCLAGCGGGGGSPSAPSTPAPPEFLRRLIVEGSQSNLPPASTGAAYIQVIEAIGIGTVTLEATVDWTFPSNPVAVAWGQGDCIQDPNCPFLVQNTTGAKPKTITASNVPEGSYSLVILNLGTTNESVSFQIFGITLR